MADYLPDSESYPVQFSHHHVLYEDCLHCIACRSVYNSAVMTLHWINTSRKHVDVRDALSSSMNNTVNQCRRLQLELLKHML